MKREREKRNTDWQKKFLKLHIAIETIIDKSRYHREYVHPKMF